jgi:hypothetical protein
MEQKGAIGIWGQDRLLSRRTAEASKNCGPPMLSDATKSFCVRKKSQGFIKPEN